MVGKAYIGTSGFSYSHWRGVFYPEGLPQKEWFAYYCQQFGSVEINSSFYRLPSKATFARWRETAGKNFVFSIKGNRYLTHIKRLAGSRDSVGKFFEALTGLRISDKEAILWQLPPGMVFDPSRLKNFLKIVPRGCRSAFEFRHQSWLNQETLEILRRFKAGVVFQDYPAWPRPQEEWPEGTADFVYLRFHGRTCLYSSCYTGKELGQWAEKIQGWLKKGLDVYGYFNNDALGEAVKNAQNLIENVRG